MVTINLTEAAEQALRKIWGPGLEAALLEALAIEGYRSGKLSSAQVGKLIGIEDRWLVNRWLADRQVPLSYSRQDLESDFETLERLTGTHV